MNNEPEPTPRSFHCIGCRMEVPAPIVVGESIECACAHHHMLNADGSIATRDPIAGPHPTELESIADAEEERITP